jgi:uncharacterized protein (TIGR02996 family)
MNESTFIQMIREHPDDDGPRLVFADWLEEQGEADRAEFIRVQIELSNLPQDDPRRSELEDRQEVLQLSHRRSWIGRFEGNVAHVIFRRGLPESVQCSAATFLQIFQTLLERWPIRELHLVEAGPHASGLAACPGITSIRSLALDGSSLTINWFNAFLASEFLDNLQSLDLTRTGMDAERLEAVVGCSRLRNLRALSLANTYLHGGSFRGLTGRLPRLETLDLSHNRISIFGSPGIEDCPLLSTLRRLILRNNDIGASEVRLLVNSPYLRELTNLVLSDNHIDDGGATAIASTSNLIGIEFLDLSSNQIAAGALALAQSSHLGRLKQLDLRRNRIGRGEARILERRYGKRVLL